jgi:hypothetical protein
MRIIPGLILGLRVRIFVPGAGGLVRRAGETEGIGCHVGTVPGGETNDRANRIGAKPAGGLPMMIRAASVTVKRWA